MAGETNWLTLLLAVLPVASISWTVTKEEIFRPLRDRAGRKLGYLLSCYYCFAHWVSLAFVLWLDIAYLGSHVLAIFVLAFLAQVPLTLFNLIRAWLGGVQARKKIAEAKARRIEQAAEQTLAMIPSAAGARPALDRAAPVTVVLDKAQGCTDAWLRQMMAVGRYDNDEEACAALRATLHALRDMLTVEQAVRLGAQLPVVLRGLYYEGWNPVRRADGQCTWPEFCERVRERLSANSAVPPARAIADTFVLLGERADPWELRKVRSALPGAVQESWRPIR